MSFLMPPPGVTKPKQPLGTNPYQQTLNRIAAPASTAPAPKLPTVGKPAPVTAPTSPQAQAHAAAGTNPLAWMAGLAPPTPTAPTGAAASDPSYLAYLRQAQYQDAAARNAAQRQLQALGQNLTLGTQNLAQQGVIAQRGIDNSMLARGEYQGGERLQKLSDERTQQAQRLAALQLGMSTRYGDVLTNLQNTLAQIANGQSEAALAAQARHP